MGLYMGFNCVYVGGGGDYVQTKLDVSNNKCLSEESYPSSQLMECDHFWIREGLDTIHWWDLGTIDRRDLGTVT